jgi:methylated-DNA-[protein]-cysteine S-methyltransferase
MTTYTCINTQLGPLMIAESENGIVCISFQNGTSAVKPNPDWEYREGLENETTRQLRDYFEGKRQTFDLPLDLQGTPFQKEVWQALLDIPYGETRTYADQALAIGRPKAVRAVGAANGKNPVPIVVPCHRVIGSDGSLTGYAGGIEIKRALLALERVHHEQTEGQLSFF